MSNIYDDSFDDLQSQRLPGDPKPQEWSRNTIRDRGGRVQTINSQGPALFPGTSWLGPEGGTVIDSESYGQRP